MPGAYLTIGKMTMAADRLGVRWGLAGGTALRSLGEARDAAQFAEEAGFDSLWISHGGAIHPLVALACLADVAPSLAEFGSSIIPLYGKHPIDIAQAALTTQSALGGRFTLGVGAGSSAQAFDKHGIAWDKPFSYTREFISALEPLLAGQAATFEGEQITARAQLIIDAPAPPILLAALGPRMLRYAAAHTQGTSLGQCGPRTIRDYIAPLITEAAERAGRTDPPRIMALVRICITDDHKGAFALAREVSAFYQAFPSYQAVLKREGLVDPAELHLIGSQQQVLDGLAEYAKAGATDLRVEVSAHNAQATNDTRDALRQYLR